MKWKIEESEYLIRNKYLSVRKDKVCQSSGVWVNDLFVLEYSDWVVVIAITCDSRFVIEEQYRHGLRQVEFELPAGCVDEGEDPLSAAKRELLEETGFGGGDWQEFMVSAPNPDSMNNICHVFLARGVECVCEPLREKSEEIMVHLETKEEVLRLLEEGKIIEGVMQAPLYRFFLYDNK